MGLPSKTAPYLQGIKIDTIDPVLQAGPGLHIFQPRITPVPIAAARIENVEAILVDLPTIRPHQLSMTTMKGQTLMILQSDPTRISRTMGAINKAVQGNNFAKCAVETALIDALGKRSQVTAAELMGGRVHDRLPVAWTLASGDTATDIAEAEEMLARRRHNIFKLKIGRGDPRSSIAHVAAIKKALGDRASIRVDVNQAWSEAIASKCLPLLSDAGVDLIEQPIAL